MLILALAVHELAAAHQAASGHGADLAANVPNPAPQAPPGLAGPVDTLLGWWKWGALVAGVFGLIGCGAISGAQASLDPGCLHRQAGTGR